MEDFLSIATVACPDHVGPIEQRLCPDVVVDRPADLILSDDAKKRKLTTARPEGKCLVLILESPHKAEFIGTPSPAKGATGTQIAKHLQNVKGLGSSSGLPLILMNAVQYQCSLGRETKYFRDRVFSAYWDRGGRDLFVARLKEVYRTDDVIACCCTRGMFRNPQEQLRQRVYDAIRLAIRDASILRRTHPCTWNFDRYRRFEWGVN